MKHSLPQPVRTKTMACTQSARFGRVWGKGDKEQFSLKDSTSVLLGYAP